MSADALLAASVNSVRTVALDAKLLDDDLGGIIGTMHMCITTQSRQ